VDVPAWPLQLLRRDHPEWAGFPLAVVADERPQAAVLWVSRTAHQLGVRIGMRHAAALGLSRELRAAPVSSARLAEARAELVGAMHRYSPRVEPDAERPGVLWVDPEGMLALFGTLERWAEALWGELPARDLFGSVVVGFERLRAWAVARTCRDARVLADPHEEARRAGQVPLARLDVPPSLEDALRLLAVRTVDDLLALSPGELGVRFGPEAARLHAGLGGRTRAPMSPVEVAIPIAIEAELDPPDDDHARLLFCIKGALHALMGALRLRALALGGLRLTLHLERGGTHVEVLRPSRASRDEGTWLELLRLRLGSVTWPARVQRLHLEAEPAPPEAAQLALLEGTRRRDPEAASRGLARVRAAFGEDAVTRARLEDGWLPEEQFRWEPVQRIARPRPVLDPRMPMLVRRLLLHAQPLASDAEGRPCTEPPIARMTGPYRLQGGWWSKGAVRDYWYAERADGAWLWLYRDAALERWFVQGIVD